MTQGFALPLSVTKLQLLEHTWLPCGGPGAGLAAAPIIPTQPCKTPESHTAAEEAPATSHLGTAGGFPLLKVVGED